MRGQRPKGEEEGWERRTSSATLDHKLLRGIEQLNIRVGRMEDGLLVHEFGTVLAKEQVGLKDGGLRFSLG